MKDTKKLEAFFKNVMIYLGHHNWTIRFHSDSYCWITDKRIDVNLKYKGNIKQLILHEIAHIDTAKYCNQKHNPQFWKRIEFLVKKFLKTKLDKYQRDHKKYMSNGIYKLIYGSKEKLPHSVIG